MIAGPGLDQGNKCILKAGGDRSHCQACIRSQDILDLLCGDGAVGDQPNPVPGDDGVQDFGFGMELFAKSPSTEVWGRDQKRLVLELIAEHRRGVMPQQGALVEQEYLLPSLGLIEIGGAQQHAHALLVHR